MGREVGFPSKCALQKRCKRNDKGEDYICRLPDEILVIILSALSMREVAQTSILSRRWRYLWTFFAGIFDFDGSETLFRFKWNEKSLKLERMRFVSWVNQVLRSHQGPSVDELKVCFDLDNHYKAAIDGWIEFAMRKEIRKLDLDLNEDYSALLIQREFYAFPSHLLKNFTLGLLTNLRLSYVSVTGEVLEYLLSHVPFLRVLHVRCSPENLQSFKYDGPNIGIPFKHVPRLVEVSFGMKFCLHAVKFLRRFSSYFMQLERLSLFLKPGNVVRAPFSLDIPELGNLKYLELKISLYNRQSLLACIPLLDASPLLQEFILKSLATRFKSLMENNTTRKYQYLKVVELVGRVGSAAVEFVTFVLENVVSLEKLIVNPCLSWSVRVSYEYEVMHAEEEEIAKEGKQWALPLIFAAEAYELFRKDITKLLCDQTAIDGWIEFATKKEVRKAELDVNEDFSALLIQREFYAFPSHLLKNFTLGLLTNLRLSYVSVTGEVLKYLLSHVPFLRVLRVRCSLGLVRFCVSGPALKLTYLEIIDCKNMENLDISAVNLLSLKCDGPNIGIPFKDVPRLVEVSFGRKFCLHAVKFLRRFSSDFMQLERLSLFLKPAPFSLDIPELGNLKYLELKVSLYNRQSLLACIPLLDASPLLQEFILKSLATRFRSLMENTRKYQYLKVVELVGRVGSAAVELSLSIHGACEMHLFFVLENVVSPCISWKLRVSYEYEVRHVEQEELANRACKEAATGTSSGG
ncbi:hypothetical protein Vadar_017407 [Vaccinium darrowii]|uniref:Uncharacterized protein n=1 Tax=Vaccinium darrowii TaxID=229202 RepID=A0ACB7Y172_9ERIC|nr:hypothetical protein Vadar_017407 [Vaccinium darrowii]